MFKFAQHGQVGHVGQRTAAAHGEDRGRHRLIKSMHTEAINHDPAITFIQTGCQQPGRPSMGAWLSYGLGSENQNLPAFVVLISQAHAITTDQPLFARLWGSGLPAVELSGRAVPRRRRPGAVSSKIPPGIDAHDAAARCSMRSAKLNTMQHDGVRRSGDRDAHRAVRDGVPDADLGAGADGSVEGAGARFELYGPESRKPGTFRRELPARAAAGRARRAVHPALSPRLGSARQPAARHRAAVQGHRPADRGAGHGPEAARLLDDTLVVWGGEFGRTVYSQGKLTDDELRPRPSPALLLHVDGRRRHQARAWSSARPTTSATTSRQIPCHVHDLHATILHCWASITRRLTYRFQGRDFRLTDVHGEVVKPILA